MPQAVRLTLLEAGPSRDAEPPVEVYAAQVESLFVSAGPLLVSIACAVVFGLIAAQRMSSPALAALAIGHVGIGVYRLELSRRYHARKPSGKDGRAVLAAWERRFAYGAFATASALGAMGFVVFALSNDPISQLLVQSLSIGYTAAIIGRNFARWAVAQGPIALTLAPTVAGAALHGGLIYETLGIFVILYWFALVNIANNLTRGGQRLLMLALDNARLAAASIEQNRRLDAALTHMPLGLCMIDADRRLEFANRRMCEMFALPQSALAPGASLVELLAAATSAQGVSAETATKLLGEMRHDGGRRGDSMLRTGDGRVLAWSQSPANDGGAVVIFEDVTEREQARARAEYLSNHDTLTGLPNRVMFDRCLNDAIERARRNSTSFALLYLALDRLKFVNDTLGHVGGDGLLEQTAARLRAALSAGDIVARVGGDEFVAILHDVADSSDALAIGEKLREALAAPYAIGGHECLASASIGLAMYPDDANEAEALLICADAAMYQVKQEGKNGVRRFFPTMRPPSIQRLELECALRHAGERNEFVLYYQPQRALATGEISGVEALLRWRPAGSDLLGPDKFIGVAEDTGLILPIGRWVIVAACLQNEMWRSQGLPELRVAVNLSPRQFADADLIGVIRHALEVSKMPARLLEIEITESMAMRDFDRSEAIIREIRGLGARISIDDFGTGHSSMARLKHLSIDALKVDRSFVRGLAFDARDRAIVEAIVALGKALRLEVVGEGVETVEQQALLAECGCDEIQGFLFARPMPADEIPGFVREHMTAQLRRIAQKANAEPPSRVRASITAQRSA